MTLQSDTDHWHAERLAALRANDGWLNLTDRIDIAPGRATVGSGADAQLRLSVGPARLGVLDLAHDGSATFDQGEGPQPFETHGDNPPQRLVGSLLLEVTALEGQHALRVRETTADRSAFPGIDRFPADPAWVIEADWVALDQPQRLAIDTVRGVSTTVTLTHEARFVHDGIAVSLLPTHWKSGKAMFVIRDATAGVETYPASRFLLAEPRGEVITLDFNRAFNPPCAFTDLAICPLPPRQNVLPFAIRAGEKAPQ